MVGFISATGRRWGGGATDRAPGSPTAGWGLRRRKGLIDGAPGPAMAPNQHVGEKRLNITHTHYDMFHIHMDEHCLIMYVNAK